MCEMKQNAVNSISASMHIQKCNINLQIQSRKMLSAAEKNIEEEQIGIFQEMWR